ncbi:hypothetical protein WR25_11107 [Diploscapter pachys]|uniref:Prefoldin subunit 3 n=1 Tax=Diploscapter pachys TaxID=2018661 RepID=A0A2A2L7P3_9BILA|nr:hypothetical protein WR25_11107 [Diploscapter pachys]
MPSTKKPDVQKYLDFIEKTLKPDYAKALSDIDRILNERAEYEILLVAITKIKESNPDPLQMKVDLGCGTFVNAVAERNDRVIVKLMDGLFAELTLDRAIPFVEKQISMLGERVEARNRVASQIRAHMDLVLSTISELQNL